MMEYMDAFNIIITAYGYMINLLPIFDKIEPVKRTPSNLLTAVCWALAFSVSVYTLFAALSIECFGIDNLK